MSAKEEYWIWYLTPRGWEKGTEKENGETKPRPIPADAVLSMKFHEFSNGSLGFGSQIQRGIDTKILNEAEAEILKKEYGATPSDMSYFKCTK